MSLQKMAMYALVILAVLYLLGFDFGPVLLEGLASFGGMIVDALKEIAEAINPL